MILAVIWMQAGRQVAITSAVVIQSAWGLEAVIGRVAILEVFVQLKPVAEQAAAAMSAAITHPPTVMLTVAPRVAERSGSAGHQASVVPLQAVTVHCLYLLNAVGQAVGLKGTSQFAAELVGR